MLLPALDRPYSLYHLTGVPQDGSKGAGRKVMVVLVRATREGASGAGEWVTVGCPGHGAACCSL